MKVVIVGGVAGGATAAARLRRLDEKMEIIMIERGEYISFANCGLPYYVGGVIQDKRDLTLQSKEGFYARYRVDVRTKSEVIEIDTKNKKVKIQDSEKEYFETYDKLILSPGAKPRDIGIEKQDGIFTVRNIPDIFSIDKYITNNNAKTAVVLGAGFIGIEMAENLMHRGLKVAIVDFAPHVLPSSDVEVANELQNYMLQCGLELYMSEKVVSVKKEKNFKIVTDKRELESDIVILATGVVPDTDVVVKAGLRCTDRGAIVVDEYMKTSDKDVFAVGDAVQIKHFVTNQNVVSPFASSANKQARLVANNICGIKEKYKGTIGTSILKFGDMVLASTGITEKTAQVLGYDYEKSFTYSPSNATYYPGASNISIKTIFDKKTGKIYGAQLIGEKGVDKRCDDFAVAIRAGFTVKDLADTDFCYAPPFSSAKDPVNIAGLVADNIVTKRVRVWHWHDVQNVLADKDAIALDVRTEYEYKHGHVEGFINIPVDELRERYGELDKKKKIYLMCRTGLRSYIAYQILSAEGFQVYNFSGGYRLYEAVVKNAYSRN